MLGRASASVILSAMTCAFALAFRADMPNAVTDCFPVFRIAGFILGAYRHHHLPLTAIRACFLVMLVGPCERQSMRGPQQRKGH